MFGKLENGNLTYAPTNLKLENGVIIVNLNKNITLMKKYGYKEIIDIQPGYDVNTQYLTIGGYSETDTEIIVNYTINEMVINNTPTLEDRVKELEEVNATQDRLIDISLLATDEIFMMIEPLLSEVNTYNVGGNNKMVDMYVAMVQRGLKTIDEVPVRYREQVKNILEQLEK